MSLLAASLAIHAWDVSVPGLLDRTGRLKAPDFLQFYTYGGLVLQHRGADIYDPAAHAEVARDRIDPRLGLSNFRPNYGPIVAWLMAPLAVLSFLPAMAVFAALSVLLYAAGVGALARRFLAEYRATAMLVAAASPALFIALRYGQLSALSVLLVAGAVLFDSRGRPLAAGVSLGLLVYKPSLLAVPVLLLALAGQWPLLAGVALAGLGQIAAGLLLAGPEAMQSYATTLVTLAATPELVQFFPTESHSIRGFARLLIGEGPGTTLIGLIAVPAVAAGGAAIWRRTDDPRVRWSALVLAMLLGAVHLLTYDLLLAAIPLVLVTAYALDGDTRPDRWWVAALAMIYAGAWPGTLIARLIAIQISTLGMALALAWLARRTRPSRWPAAPS